MSERNPILDVAIVGGGVAGLYCGYRLASENPGAREVALFESFDEIGGRLWSTTVPGSDVVVELGGAFFSDLHRRVDSLIRQHLGLTCEPVNMMPGVFYMRGRHLTTQDFLQWRDIPYRIGNKEFQIFSSVALNRLVTKFLPALSADLLTSTDPCALRELLAELRAAEYQGRPLTDWSIYDLLSKLSDYETIDMLKETSGGGESIFGAANAYDALVTYFLSSAQYAKFYRITSGYQSLPETLGRRFEEMGGELQRSARVLGYQVESHGGEELIRLRIAYRSYEESRLCRSLILAIPAGALQHLELGDGQLTVDSIIGFEKWKSFLGFDESWWRADPAIESSLSSGNIVASFSDLPNQSSYFYPQPDGARPQVMQAAFAMGERSRFFSSCAPTPDELSASWRLEVDPWDSKKQHLLVRDEQEIVMAMLRRMLSSIHGLEVPEPTTSLHVDWSRKPFHHGFHIWRAGIKSWEVAKTLTKPFTDQRVYLCGDCYSTLPGWVEGALKSSEDVLVEHFGLAKPKWH